MLARPIVCLAWVPVLFGVSATVGESQDSTKASDNWVEVLRGDSRLNRSLTLKSQAWPTAEELINEVRKLTGVPLSWGGEGDKTKVIFGTTQVVNVPAWKVLEQLATAQVTDGRWDKVDDGYVLRGKPKDFGPAAQYARSVKGKAAQKFPGNSEKDITGATDAGAFATRHPLAADARLKARFRLVEKHPTLADLINRLTTATGLKFTLADNLANHEPDFGEFTLPNVAAFTVMELIAQRDLEGGRWDKTTNGYCLFGKSLVARPSEPSRWPLGAAIVATAVVAFGFLIVRYRRLPPRRLS